MSEEEQDSFLIGEPSPDGKWWAIFEDNGETGYLYLTVSKPDGSHGEIVDDLWVYNQIAPPIQECKVVEVLWLKDSSRAILHVDNECWGILWVHNGLLESDGEPLRMVRRSRAPQPAEAGPDSP